MDDRQIHHFHEMLMEERARLVRSQADARESGKTVELDQARVGRLSRMDAMQGQQMALETLRRNRKRLQDIESALARIEQPGFGDCKECGVEIDPRRLELDPAARRCIDCAE